jgi:hypothetical protein
MTRREEIEAAIVGAFEGKGFPEALDRQLRLEDRERLRRNDPVKWCVERLDVSAVSGMTVSSDWQGRVCFDLYTPARLEYERGAEVADIFEPGLDLSGGSVRKVLVPESTRRLGLEVDRHAAWEHEDQTIDWLIARSRELAPGVKARRHPDDPTRTNDETPGKP